MTETEVKLSQLQENIPHLRSISEEGWHLQWGNTPGKGIELICKEATTLQVQKIDALMTQAYQKALAWQPS